MSTVAGLDGCRLTPPPGALPRGVRQGSFFLELAYEGQQSYGSKSFNQRGSHAPNRDLCLSGNRRHLLDDQPNRRATNGSENGPGDRVQPRQARSNRRSRSFAVRGGRPVWDAPPNQSVRGAVSNVSSHVSCRLLSLRGEARRGHRQLHYTAAVDDGRKPVWTEKHFHGTRYVLRLLRPTRNNCPGTMSLWARFFIQRSRSTHLYLIPFESCSSSKVFFVNSDSYCGKKASASFESSMIVR